MAYNQTACKTFVKQRLHSAFLLLNKLINNSPLRYSHFPGVLLYPFRSLRGNSNVNYHVLLWLSSRIGTGTAPSFFIVHLFAIFAKV